MGDGEESLRYGAVKGGGVHMGWENVRLQGLLYGKDLIKYDNSGDTHYTVREI